MAAAPVRLEPRPAPTATQRYLRALALEPAEGPPAADRPERKRYPRFERVALPAAGAGADLAALLRAAAPAGAAGHAALLEAYLVSLVPGLPGDPLVGHWLPEEGALEALWPPPATEPASWPGLDAALLFSVVLPRAWRRLGERGLLAAAVEAGAMAERALAEAQRRGLAALLLNPPPAAEAAALCDLPESEAVLAAVGLPSPVREAVR